VTAAERATTLADVVAAGAIAENTIRANYDGATHTATVDTAGNVTYQQTTYRSLSAAGEAMKVALRGPNIPDSVKATDGWSFWSATDTTGQTVKLKELRRRRCHEASTRRQRHDEIAAHHLRTDVDPYSTLKVSIRSVEVAHDTR
jgi:hypothetical protein